MHSRPLGNSDSCGLGTRLLSAFHGACWFPSNQKRQGEGVDPWNKASLTGQQQAETSVLLCRAGLCVHIASGHL